LSTDGLRHGLVYQLITFQFLHADFWHLFGNVWVIFMFGRMLEELVGSRTFLKIYFLGGTIGGIVQMLFGFADPQLYGTAVYGASAGAFAVLAALATHVPNERISLLLLPISFPLKYLLFVEGAFAIIGVLRPYGMIAHAAHLGGMLTGIAYIRFVVLGNHSPIRWRPFGREEKKRELVNVTSAKRPNWRRARVIEISKEELPPGEFISREVDPILDKISAHGIHSLTDRERQILDAARKKMAGK
jgi:membrane associated rhomboid family serine protease